jgi:hypothetical protein
VRWRSETLSTPRSRSHETGLTSVPERARGVANSPSASFYALWGFFCVEAGESAELRCTRAKSTVESTGGLANVRVVVRLGIDLAAIRS